MRASSGPTALQIATIYNQAKSVTFLLKDGLNEWNKYQPKERKPGEKTPFDFQLAATDKRGICSFWISIR